MADDDAAATTKTPRRRRSTGVDGISALPEHLQHEVFSRVGDIKALFRFAATCRGCLRRFTDRAFLRELCPGSQGEGSGQQRARLLGVFVQDKWFNRSNKATVQARMTGEPPPQRSSSSSALAPVFFPAPGSPLGPAGRALTSFAGGGDDDGTFDYAELLAARRGTVLVRLAPRVPDEMDCHLFGVCNPVTGDRCVLPPLKCIVGGRRLFSYAIIQAADDSSGNGRPGQLAARFTFSQLLVITRGPYCREGDMYLHSYSAATRRWSKPTACLDSSVFSMVGDSSAVVHRGTAHWLCVEDGPLRRKRAWAVVQANHDDDDHHLYRLSVEVATARVSMTRLPVRYGGKQLLCITSDGKLAVASMYPGHVTVCTQPSTARDDEGDSTTPAAAVAWPRTSFRIPAAVPYSQIDPQLQYQERWCNFNHGSLIALFRGSGVFILDLDTKVMEKVYIVDFDNEAMAFVAGDKKDLSCVPYEMDLVELFTLLLGGIQERLGTATATSETESL